MTKQVAALGLALLGLSAVQGCKTTTTQVAPAGPSVGLFLLEEGAEPRAALRYAIKEGATTKSTTTVRVRTTVDEVSNSFLSGLRSVELEVVYGPAEVTGDRIKYPLQIVESRAAAGPDASKAAKKKLEEQAALLRGAGAVVEIDDRGNLRGSQMNAVAAQIPVRVLWDLLATLLTVSQVMLPEEPVGLGARWQHRGMIAIYGLRLEQVVTYTLSERIDDKSVLEIDFEQLGQDQMVDIPGSEAPVQVDSARMTATGRTVLDLKSLVSSGSVSGLVRDELVVSEGGKQQKAIVERLFEVQIASQQ